MGLIGGVKSWMEGSKRKNLSDSRAQSPRGEDGDSEDSSGADESSSRGRRMGSEDEDGEEEGGLRKRPKLIVEDMEGEV
jgi:choline-phosphate cytidylyltransferase